MLLKKVLTPLVAVVALLSYGTVSADFITNGSFEDPDIATGTWTLHDDILGWKVIGDGKIEIQDHVAGSPFDGDQFLELDSTKPSTISQTIANLFAGQQYELSFAFSARSGTSFADDNVLSVLWNNENVFLAAADTANRTWTTYSILVTAGAEINKLTLADASPNRRNSYGVYVDNVRLTAVTVPEPGTLALLGLGLFGMGLARRKSRA